VGEFGLGFERGEGGTCSESWNMGSKWSLRPNIEQGRKLLNRFNMLSSKSKAIDKYKKEVLEFLQQQLEGSLRAFTFEELSAATQDFDQLLFLGEGGFGKVYKGFLSDPSPAASTTLENGPSRRYQEVAVKRLRIGGLQVFAFFPSLPFLSLFP